jgi:hypothetical protein
MSAWADTADATAHWHDAAGLAPDVLERLLDAAQEQCETYAPALADAAVVPTTYTLAVIYQARETHAAALRSESDVIGVGDYVIRSRPLTGVVKQLLRPRSARPVVR